MSEDPADEKRRSNSVQSVVFALNIIEHLANQKSAVGVSELARTFHTTKSRMHRHLRTLGAAGYIVRDGETERYRISMRLMALGQAIGNNFDLTAAARPTLSQLRETLGHSTVLSIPEPEGMRIVFLMRGKSSLEIGVKPGSVMHYHNSAQGKIALAFGDQTLYREVLAGELAMSTPYSIADPQKLAAEIAAVRARGWAVAPNESTIGLNALAAPVFDAFGNLVGTLAIVDSIQFIGANPTPDQVRHVMQAAAKVSESLGLVSNGSPAPQSLTEGAPSSA
jgi:DNA-binding IclR family transcriptional regulator